MNSGAVGQETLDVHLFTVYDKFFAFVPGTGKFLHLDKCGYDLLQRLQEDGTAVPVDGAEATALREAGVPESALAELALLATHGIFGASESHSPDFHVSEEEVSRRIRQRYKQPWRKIELALTENCNLSCKYCYGSSYRKTGEVSSMDRATAKRALDWLFAASRDRSDVAITLFGGEPLLNRDVFRFVVDYSQELGKRHGKRVRYVMTTNATLLDDEAIRYIKKHRFGLMISMDGPPGVHDAQRPFRNGTGSFGTASARIQKLMKVRKRVTARCTFTRKSGKLAPILEFLDQMGFSRIALSPATNSINPTEWDCDRQTLEELENEIETSVLPRMLEELRAGRIPKYFPYASFIQEHGTGSSSSPSKNHLRCGSCFGELTVGGDGKLYPCHRYVGTANRVMGLAGEAPDMDRIEQYWQGYYRALNRICGGCWARVLCDGPCSWTLEKSDGGFTEDYEEWHCDLQKRRLEIGAYVLWYVQTNCPDILNRSRGEQEG